MLLDGVNHIAWISKDVDRLGRFYTAVFDAVVGPTRDHGPGETMTVIDIGPATQLNVFVIDGNTEADRQTPMWGRGRIDHIGLAAASQEAFETIRSRLIDAGASDGAVNDFGTALSQEGAASGRRLHRCPHALFVPNRARSVTIAAILSYARTGLSLKQVDHTVCNRRSL